MGKRARAQWLEFMGIGAMCLLTLGCNTQAWPETYPVVGKVVTKDGKPHTSGLISFMLASDPSIKCGGGIAEDGTFTLNTVSRAEDASSKTFTGRAPAGEYDVSIYPYPGTAGGGRAAYTLKKKYIIEPNESNDITVVMEPVVK